MSVKRLLVGPGSLLSGVLLTFTYTDYADAARARAMTLDGVEFLRRWVQHVLPRGFVKVRHVGLLANRHRDAKLAACRRQLSAAGVGPARCDPAPSRPDRCPVCGAAAWRVGDRFGPAAPAPGVGCRAVVRVDSS